MWYVFVEYLPYSRKGAQYWDGVVNVTVRNKEKESGNYNMVCNCYYKGSAKFSGSSRTEHLDSRTREVLGKISQK